MESSTSGLRIFFWTKGSFPNKSFVKKVRIDAKISEKGNAACDLLSAENIFVFLADFSMLELQVMAIIKEL